MSGEGQRGKVDWYVKYCTVLCKCRNRQKAVFLIENLAQRAVII